MRVFFIISFLIFFYTVAQASSKCLLCHSVIKARIEGRKGFIVNVYIDSERFSGSVHGSLDCTDCHLSRSKPSPEPSKEKATPDISELLAYTSIKSKVDPLAPASCVRCHKESYSDLKNSIHGEDIFKKKQLHGPLCLDCHGDPHYILTNTNHADILYTCGRCHPHIIERYKESLHGKKYMHGDKKAPLCNDCHGSHNIKRWNATGSPLLGQGKVKTCKGCHKTAGERFAQAPEHKQNPIPYYGERLFTILVLGVFGFTILHLLGDAYSELRDKQRKKKRKDG